MHSSSFYACVCAFAVVMRLLQAVQTLSSLLCVLIVQLLQMLRQKGVLHQMSLPEEVRAQKHRLQSNEDLIVSQLLRLTESLQLFASY